MIRRGNILSNTDWITVLFYLLLVVFGWMNIYSVNYVEAEGFDFQVTGVGSNRYSIQLMWIGISLIVAIIIFLIDSRFYNFIAYPTYLVAIVLLVFVLTFGKEINGSKSWISIGSIGLQPSEFAKLTTILAIARFLSGFNIKANSAKNILISLGIIAVPFFLILLQPDFGSTLVYGILLLVLYREGFPGWILFVVLLFFGVFVGYFLLSPTALIAVVTTGAFFGFLWINRSFKNFSIGFLICVSIIALVLTLRYLGVISLGVYISYQIGLAVAVVVLLIIAASKKIKGGFIAFLFLVAFIGFVYSINFVFHNVMQPHQQKRVEVMFGLKKDPWGYEYNINQSKIAIGSGGFAGRGFLKGPQTKLKYVPEQSTDFIFCTVGEEWGFLGSLAFIALFIALLLRLIYIAERQRSRFSRIFAYGVVTILFFHFAVNVAMVLALFPVIGIPLPFISYGGSSLLSFTMMIFILLRLDSTRKYYLI